MLVRVKIHVEVWFASRVCIIEKIFRVREEILMNIARVRESGRVKIPSEAIRNAQEAFKGAADMLGVKNDDDVQALVDEVRYGKIRR